MYSTDTHYRKNEEDLLMLKTQRVKRIVSSECRGVGTLEDSSATYANENVK